MRSNLRHLISALLLITLLLTPALAQYSRRTPIVEAFEANKDAIVSIQSTEVVATRDSFFWGFDDWPFTAPSRLVPVPSLGSGFIINDQGYVITNAHVVARAQDVKVIFADGSKLQADIVAIDNSSDLAVLKIRTDDPLPVVNLGTSSDLMIGETVLAIGNPFGYEHTLTEGIISAIHRDLVLNEGKMLGDLIQISAPINPGNSGGPLLNINGQVIGINTAIRRAAQGIGFAIPIDALRNKLPEMLDIEQLYRIDFGAEITDAAPGSLVRNVSNDTPASDTAGALVQNVQPDTAAAQAGLQKGDIITAVNNTPVENTIDFYLQMLEVELGSEVTFTVKRSANLLGSRQTTITMPVNQRPKPDGIELARRLMGLEVATLTRRMARQYDRIVGEPGNVVILDAERNSPADRAGLRSGDVIATINNTPVQSVEDLGLALEFVQPDEKITITVNRSQQRGWMLLPVEYRTTLTTREKSGFLRDILNL